MSARRGDEGGRKGRPGETKGRVELRSFGARVWAIVSAVARGGVWSTDGMIARTLVFFLKGTLEGFLRPPVAHARGLAGVALAIVILLGVGGVGCTETGEGFGDLFGDLQPSEGVDRGALMPSGALGPRVIYLDYADGTALPRTLPNACHAAAPAFRCVFGRTMLDCQRQIQAYLDRWYADFNVVFTLTRPTSGAFNTVVVTSGGAYWCGLDPNVAGAAPFLCDDISGGAVYAFRGGEQAKETAIIIAQEQAHLVGLEHTDSEDDLMSPTICETCDGFARSPQAVVSDRCNRKTQSSYQMMMDRLGAWPGGPKPSAFGCQSDSRPPTVRFVEPEDQTTVGSEFSVQVAAIGDCDVAKVDVAVAPQVLRASATAPPYRWDLSNITGPQTIEVTVTDIKGHVAVSTINVMARGGETASSGCAVGGGAVRGANARTIVASLGIMWLAAAGRRRRRRQVSAAAGLKRSLSRPADASQPRTAAPPATAC